ncbi:hypothetical protein [Ramlibacter sp.]|uniref:hypothetical protein n=1 Tax=Ramlibacter sp. TaxID=1917967 RepID=UPI002C4337E8|nr:hypothetical protein [Ramlibacter sp.]HWI83481.1 hypothetical protein [Ramlibacter sp.]
MQDFYSFHFLETISNQLKARLDLLTETQLDGASLATLRDYQIEKASCQGVYLLQYHGVPAYLGKATDVCDRLGQHLEKRERPAIPPCLALTRQ